ncbi:MAG TPA: hypothetical protein VKA30_09875 [Actinomycetota bacterium]|nr:hypothetical protein [Actinomycetota bacterium]
MFGAPFGRGSRSRSSWGADQQRVEFSDEAAYDELIKTLDAIIRDLSTGDPGPAPKSRRRRSR